ncbi:hypothetical protein F5Y19DRAFT_487039 [Xylariaceae sp. FL1651]|nr:hypothetical protein F5Y19DRAFT_487039 [Xylariaceae sp. FL1651]
MDIKQLLNEEETLNRGEETLKELESINEKEPLNDEKPIKELGPLKEFHCYPRLPPELKLKIWQFAYDEYKPGAHMFKLTLDSKNPTRLIVKPDEDQRADRSAWRERLKVSKVCELADAVRLLADRKNVSLFKDTTSRRTVYKEENGVEAMVNGENDLVVFKHRYGDSRAEVELLCPIENSQTFAGITRLGIDIDWFRGGKYLSSRNCFGKYNPFPCQCGRHCRVCCTEAIVRFARFFKNLDTFYLLFNLRTSYLRQQGQPDSLADAPQVLIYGGPVTTPISQLSVDVFAYFQDIANRQGLEQFHDRAGTYCEITRPDSLFVIEHHDFLWDLLLGVKRAWAAYHTDQETKQAEDGKGEAEKPRWSKTTFKALVWLDLYYVFDKKYNRLRELKPWK